LKIDFSTVIKVINNLTSENGTVQGAVATWRFVGKDFRGRQVATAPCTVPIINNLTCKVSAKLEFASSIARCLTPLTFCFESEIFRFMISNKQFSPLTVSVYEINMLR
jgi:hypothetical protein